MPKPVTIGQIDFTADEERNMRESARRARETAASRMQGRPRESVATLRRFSDDGSQELVERKPLND